MPQEKKVIIKSHTVAKLKLDAIKCMYGTDEMENTQKN